VAKAWRSYAGGGSFLGWRIGVAAAGETGRSTDKSGSFTQTARPYLTAIFEPADSCCVLGFYDRYQTGEHQQVWLELVALGDAVRQEPVYSDALAVASETMRRARENIQTLIGRLYDIGYNFTSGREAGVAVARMLEGLAAQTPDLLKMAGSIPSDILGVASGWIARPQDAQAGIERLAKSMMGIGMALPLMHPLNDGAVCGRASDYEDLWSDLDSIEGELRGPLPLSLRAWYENIHHVSFMGTHPILNPKGHHAPTLSSGTLPDPLVILALEEVTRGFDEPGPCSISFDDVSKFNFSGGEYNVRLPDKGADLIFEDWKKDYFVEYLRRVFRWGGFPGWERHPHPPIELIGELSEGLLLL
jgi:hypothetical protein